MHVCHLIKWCWWSHHCISLPFMQPAVTWATLNIWRQNSEILLWACTWWSCREHIHSSMHQQPTLLIWTDERRQRKALLFLAPKLVSRIAHSQIILVWLHKAAWYHAYIPFILPAEGNKSKNLDIFLELFSLQLPFSRKLVSFIRQSLLKANTAKSFFALSSLVREINKRLYCTPTLPYIATVSR